MWEQRGIAQLCLATSLATLLEPNRPLWGHGCSGVPALGMGWEPVALQHGQTTFLGCSCPSRGVVTHIPPQLLGPQALPSHAGDAPDWLQPLGFGSYPPALRTCPAPQWGPAWSPRAERGPPPAMQGFISLLLPVPSKGVGARPSVALPASLRVRAAAEPPPPRPRPLSGGLSPPSLSSAWVVSLLAGLQRCSCGCTSRSTAEPSACPCMLPGQYIYRRYIYIFMQ